VCFTLFRVFRVEKWNAFVAWINKLALRLTLLPCVFTTAATQSTESIRIVTNLLTMYKLIPNSSYISVSKTGFYFLIKADGPNKNYNPCKPDYYG
jgi:hypothetical protein